MHMNPAYEERSILLKAGAVLISWGPVCAPLTARGILQGMSKELVQAQLGPKRKQ